MLAYIVKGLGLFSLFFVGLSGLIELVKLVDCLRQMLSVEVIVCICWLDRCIWYVYMYVVLVVLNYLSV